MGSVEELDDALRAVHGVDPYTDPDAVRRLAAVQVTMWAWRNSPFEDVQIGVPASEAPLRFAAEIQRALEQARADGDLDEPYVGGLDDGEMMAANVEATVVVLRHLTREAADWDGITEELCDPERLVAGQPLSQRSAQDEVAALYPHIRATLSDYRALDALVGWPRLQRALALMATSAWWGAPEWPDSVDVFLTELEPRAWDDARVAGQREADLRDQLVRAPHRLGPTVLNWALENGLRYPHGRTAYEQRIGLARDWEPTNRAWANLTSLSGVRPAPSFWEYARRDLKSYTPVPGTYRPPSRQVVLRYSVSVWVNALTCAGLTRLLTLAGLDYYVWLNGNPLTRRSRVPAWLVGQPAVLGSGSVVRAEESWLVVAVDEDVDAGVIGFAAAFVDLTDGRGRGPARVDRAALTEALGAPGTDGRCRARLWVGRGKPRDPVTVLHWPTPAEVAAAVCP